MTHVWRLHGFLRSTAPDREPMFVSALWCASVTQFGRDYMTIASYPEADDQTECTNRKLAQYLLLYTQQDPAASLDFLSCLEYVCCATVHSSTRCSPTVLVYTEA